MWWDGAAEGEPGPSLSQNGAAGMCLTRCLTPSLQWLGKVHGRMGKGQGKRDFT